MLRAQQELLAELPRIEAAVAAARWVPAPPASIFRRVIKTLNWLEKRLPFGQKAKPPPRTPSGHPIPQPSAEAVHEPGTPQRPLEALRAPSQATFAALGISPRVVVEIPAPCLSFEDHAAACRVLLLRVVWRAACDWVLFRASAKSSEKRLAEQARRYLFVENEGSPGWQQRAANGKGLLSFLSICGYLHISPQLFRERIEKLTFEEATEGGRPVSLREVKTIDATFMDEHSVHSICIDELPSFDVDMSPSATSRF